MKISELPRDLQYEITEVSIELQKLEDERQRLIDDMLLKINNFQTQTQTYNKGE